MIIIKYLLVSLPGKRYIYRKDVAFRLFVVVSVLWADDWFSFYVRPSFNIIIQEHMLLST
jgi:hypothetical protein